MRLQDLLYVGILFVAIAIVLGFGGQILQNIANTQTANSVALNVTNYGLTSLNTFGSWLPTLALVVVAAIVIGIIFAYFLFGNKQG